MHYIIICVMPDAIPVIVSTLKWRGDAFKELNGDFSFFSLSLYALSLASYLSK